ncbi:hypothetical protein TcG_09406 [Trypanosoma cruzi]|nr:hypothetical protein TcG_09406 [Trypanosoma cruzi]
MTVLRVLVVALALLLQLGLLFLPVLLFVPAIVVAVVFAIVTVVSLLLLPLLVDTHLFPFLLLEFLLEILLFALTALKAFRDFLNFQHLLQRFSVLHLRFDNFFLPFLPNMLPEFFLVILHFLVPLVVDLMCLFLAVKVVLVPARLYRHSNDHQAKRQQLPYPPLHHIYRQHRTTARRGHTPAAHDQSSSPSLLSLACSLQHKLTTRQRRVKAKGEIQGRYTQPLTAKVTNSSSPAAEHTP